jgi:transposase
MTSTTHQPESTMPGASPATGILYVSLELSKKEWLLTMGIDAGGRRERAHVEPGHQAQLATALAAAKRRFGLPVDAPVRSCYEAGFDGFWPARLLTALGVVNLVVDSSSIEVPRGARRVKTDRLDGRKLLQMLWRYWGGERDVWRVVRVPAREVEDARHASRATTTLVEDRTRYRNRIRNLLRTHGVVRPVRLDQHFPACLLVLRDWAGAPLPPGVQARVLEAWRLLRVIEEALTAARQAEQARVQGGATAAMTQAGKLVRLCGVAARSATVLGDEVFTRDLRNRREVGGLTGLVSAPYQSGETRRDQGLTRRGLPGVRRVAVQLAWAWLRYQPESALSQWYQRHFGRGSAGLRRVGIVALARRLMIALWRYVTFDVVPEGARFKA